MRYHQYRELPPSLKIELWEELLNCEAWEVLGDLADHYVDALATVNSTDAKEEFYFRAAKQVGAKHILGQPDSLLSIERRNLKDKA